MFDFLQHLSHQHPAKQKPQPDLPHNQFDDPPPLPPHSKRQSPPPKKNISKGLSLSAQIQQGQPAALDEKTFRLLEMMKEQSQKWFSGGVLQMVTEEKAKVERKVYLREMSDTFEEYLEQVLAQSSNPNRFIRHGIAEIVDSVAGSIYDDILLTNKYQVGKKTAMSKDEMILLEKSIKQIHSKEGSIRDKVGQLKLQLQNESMRINQRSEDIINKKSFSIDDPKTKEVESFLKSLQMERQQQRMRYEEEREREREKRRRREQIMEVARQKAKSQRHERLAEAYQIRRKVKQEQIDMEAKRNRQFQEYLKVFRKKKPLFKEKEEQFMNMTKEQRQEAFSVLMRRKEAYAPISFEEIEDHEERYLQYKQDEAVRKREERKMNSEAEKKRLKDLSRLHKGEFRLHVLQQLVQKKEELSKDPKQDIKMKKARQMLYSENVKQFCKPTIDPAKQMEIQQLTNPKRKKRVRNPIRVRSSIGESGQQVYSNYGSGDDEEEVRDPKKEGERNRRYFKQFIREKIERGEIKKAEDPARSMTIEPKTNYLEEMRKQRQSDSRVSRAHSIDHEIESLSQKADVSSLVSKVQKFDERSRRLEEKFRMAPHKPEEEAELEHNYLFSIKAKMQLLDNYN